MHLSYLSVNNRGPGWQNNHKTECKGGQYTGNPNIGEWLSIAFSWSIIVEAKHLPIPSSPDELFWNYNMWKRGKLMKYIHKILNCIVLPLHFASAWLIRVASTLFRIYRVILHIDALPTGNYYTFVLFHIYRTITVWHLQHITPL